MNKGLMGWEENRTQPDYFNFKTRAREEMERSNQSTNKFRDREPDASSVLANKLDCSIDSHGP